MLDTKVQVLLSSIRKLYRRGGYKNIQKILEKTHTADIAPLLEELEPEERLEIFQAIENGDRKAEVFSYLESKFQEELVHVLSHEEIRELVSDMDSDDAAKMLRSLEDEVSSDILASMEKEDQTDVEALLKYREDSAGGIMNPDFLAFSQQASVKEAISKIQELEDDSMVNFYIYVTNENEQLTGVLSLKQLILSRPNEKLEDLMLHDVIRVNVEIDQEEVARTVERYDFLSVPVVDDTNKLVGVITVDDVIDVIREEAKEDLLGLGYVGSSHELSLRGLLTSRFPWILISMIGGILCFLLTYWYLKAEAPKKTSLVAASIPLLLAVGSTVGHQISTLTIAMMRNGMLDRKGFLSHFWQEIKSVLILSALAGAMVLVISYLAFGKAQTGYALGIILMFHLLVVTFLGAGTSLFLKRVGIDPAVATISIFTVLANISGTVVSTTLGAYLIY